MIWSGARAVVLSAARRLPRSSGVGWPEAVDYWLNSLDGLAMRERRNGTYSRHLLSEFGFMPRGVGEVLAALSCRATGGYVTTVLR